MSARGEGIGLRTVTLQTSRRTAHMLRRALIAALASEVPSRVLGSASDAKLARNVLLELTEQIGHSVLTLGPDVVDEAAAS